MRPNVNARLSVSLLMALVLFGGVTLKILAIQRAEIDPNPFVVAAASGFLERRGFSILGRHQNLDLTLMGAQKAADCRMILASMAPQGWHGGAVRQMAGDGDELFFVFDGAVFREQPATQARLQLYLSLFLRRLGFSAPYYPLLGVIADPACHADAYPWAELASITLRPVAMSRKRPQDDDAGTATMK